MNICIIPARGGSQRIPRKNIRVFHGRPIIAYSIAAAMEVCDMVIVSSDDDEVLSISKNLGAGIIKRSDFLSQNDIGTQEVAASVLEDLGVRGGLAVVIYPCAPMLTAETLKSGIVLLEETGCDFVVPMSVWPRDPGQFYAGEARAFVERRPLASPRTRLLSIPENTDCDINTEEDWLRAEEMYDKWRNN